MKQLFSLKEILMVLLMKVFSQELKGEDSCFPLPFGNVN